MSGTFDTAAAFEDHLAARKNAMSELSIIRLYVLRAGYALIAVGLSLLIFPGIIWPGENVPHMNGVVRSLLGAVAVLSFIGLRYPVRMIPVLLFELIWKTIWLIAFGLPLWRAGRLDADTSETMANCIFGVIVVVIVVPWKYVLRNYLTGPGDRWGGLRVPGIIKLFRRPRGSFLLLLFPNNAYRQLRRVLFGMVDRVSRRYAFHFVVVVAAGVHIPVKARKVRA